MQPQTFVFFGIVGSGKGTQVDLLRKYLENKKMASDILYTSTGVEFRKIMESGSYTGQLVKETLEKGFLQPNFITTSLFTNILISGMQEEATKRLRLRGRHDDTDQGIRKRFDEYVNNVIPAMNYFKDKENYTIYTINGEQTVEAVHKDIIKALGY